jgi:hypothetical protein
MSDLLIERKLHRHEKKALLRVILDNIAELDDWSLIVKRANRAADLGVPAHLIVKVVQSGFRRHIDFLVSFGSLNDVAYVVLHAIKCGVNKQYLSVRIRIAMNREYGHNIKDL